MGPWDGLLEAGVAAFLGQAIGKNLNASHTADTPARVVKAFKEYISGYLEDPAAPLQKRFEGKYDEMVHVRRIHVVSMCAHHLAPILGMAHFAYIPNGEVIGLSKVPRFIGILSRRLQIQENLTEEIVDLFQSVVQPIGCAVYIRAYHCCMLTRGVREHATFTDTVALRGVMKSEPNARAEYLGAINYQEDVFL